MTRYAWLVLGLLGGCAGTGTYSQSDSNALRRSDPGALPAATSAAPKAEATPKRDRLEGIPLVWKPTTRVADLGVVDLTGLSNVKLRVDRLTDTRTNPQLIGQNREEVAPRKVTTPDDVGAFATERVRRIISDARIDVVDSGATRVLKGELAQFFVDETQTYKSEVRLQVTLTDAGGRELWTGTTGGKATRFGRSYKPDNYYETLSDALLEAIYNLLQTNSFHDALAKQ